MCASAHVCHTYFKENILNLSKKISLYCSIRVLLALHIMYKLQSIYILIVQYIHADAP